MIDRLKTDKSHKCCKMFESKEAMEINRKDEATKQFKSKLKRL